MPMKYEKDWGTDRRKWREGGDQRTAIIEGINNVTFVQKKRSHCCLNFHKLSTKAECKSKSH